MKQQVFVLLVAFFASASVFGQNILDYFPVEIGNSWTYANSKGLKTDVITVIDSSPDSNNRDGRQYLFRHVMFDEFSIWIIYIIKDGMVVMLAKETPLVGLLEYEDPFPIVLALAGVVWQDDMGDDESHFYRTIRSSVKYDDKSFDDCILVEERVYIKKKPYRATKSYYARGIGLVCITVQSPEQEEHIFQRLVEFKRK